MNNITFKKDLLGVQDDLLRFAYKLTSDREEANDLLQETSLKALDNEEKYTPDTNFKGWIYTIMRNIFINNYRKVVRDQTFVDTTDNLYHLNLPRDAAFESTESAYDLKEMHRIVNALPREYKIPFSMYEDYTSLKETSYEPDGLRALLLNRNKEVVTKMNQLKQDKADNKLTEEQYDEKVSELRKTERTSPIVLIKATDEASYKNLIDVLDEMHICNISKYAIVDITDGDKFLMENLLSKGGLTDQIDRSK